MRPATSEHVLAYAMAKFRGTLDGKWQTEPCLHPKNTDFQDLNITTLSPGLWQNHNIQAISTSLNLFTSILFVRSKPPWGRNDRKRLTMAGIDTETSQRKCLGADCENDARSLPCPTCQKLGKPSYFCSQDCFKRNWVSLRALVPVNLGRRFKC